MFIEMYFDIYNYFMTYAFGNQVSCELNVARKSQANQQETKEYP